MTTGDLPSNTQRTEAKEWAAIPYILFSCHHHLELGIQLLKSDCLGSSPGSSGHPATSISDSTSLTPIHPAVKMQTLRASISHRCEDDVHRLPNGARRRGKARFRGYCCYVSREVLRPGECLRSLVLFMIVSSVPTVETGTDKSSKDAC